MGYGRMWAGFVLVIVLSFGVLGYYGYEIWQQAPPIPKRVVTTTGEVLFTQADIQDGQNVWQSIGGQEVGTVWGHGAYVAPDWSADWLHREAVWTLDYWAEAEHGHPLAQVTPEVQAGLIQRLTDAMRTNTYDPYTGDLVVSPTRAQAIAAVSAHYTSLFGSDPALDKLRTAYALPRNTIVDPERQRMMNSFFFWAAWACGTDRPGQSVTYTNNWPHEPLIANNPTASVVLWSIVSVVVLLAGIGAMVFYMAARRRDDEGFRVPAANPLAGLQLTPSMRATQKYFWVVVALFVAQIGMGIVTAHYGVEGQAFYGIPLARWLPYSVTRTWHLQLGIFWIATAWLATGLFVAPAVGGHEPKYQKLGVNFLFLALLVLVVGSMAGQWLGVMQRLGFGVNFWFGHQGYEYVDLGRFWQLLLTVGLMLWLVLVGAAIWPAIKTRNESRSLIGMFLVSAVAIGGFYMAGLMWGRHTNLALAEYWRWWVVHLWVEGFFEVFATAVIAFLFSRMGLVKLATATTSVILTSTIYLTGGIIGTMHHLYFSGITQGVMAWGATFSALEIVPLVLVGFEAYETWKLSSVRPWVRSFKWPIYFFVAVGFWNLVGAGLFGFLINPPISLYYMQGLNTTPVHGHAALYGVYGMLGLGLLLFCMKGFSLDRHWKDGSLKVAFWALNVGLLLMVTLSLLPVGLLQAAASISQGTWYARSADFLQLPHIQTLRWMRIVGDSIFSVGVMAFAWFFLGLVTGRSLGAKEAPDTAVEDQPAERLVANLN